MSEPTPDLDQTEIDDAAARFLIFASRLADAGMDTETLLHGQLAATVQATSEHLHPDRRKQFARFLRNWAKAIERGDFDPRCLDA